MLAMIRERHGYGHRFVCERLGWLGCDTVARREEPAASAEPLTVLAVLRERQGASRRCRFLLSQMPARIAMPLTEART
jgi:hypothetical protein